MDYPWRNASIAELDRMSILLTEINKITINITPFRYKFFVFHNFK